MEIKVGAFYKTRGGQKARIYAVDGCNGEVIHGAIFQTGQWASISWLPSGSAYSNSQSEYDLIEEWTEPKKTKELWLWVYYLPDSGYHTSKEWMSEEQVKKWFNSIGGKLSGYKLIGKCPNCVKPLVVEE